jgi:hypothetical protein
LTVKKKRQTSQEPAIAYKKGRIPLDAALEKHFRNLGLSIVNDNDFLTIQLVIGFGNLGAADRIVSLSGDRRLTVAQVIEEYKLRPFLEERDNQ